ncbi:MAG: radical SAM protein [Deltaproteobacteria bacterium]|nr:MAG: radical SAM protein [Deltaproteobacteria bacterium]
MNVTRHSDPCVLLISPGIIKWTDMDFGLPHLVALGGYLQHHLNVRVEILDLNYEGGDHNQLLRTIESLGPHVLIGLSCYSSFDFMRVMTLARFLRRNFPETPMVTGGYHASALPQDLVFEGSPFDAVVVGEGEEPMREMVETLLGGGRLDKQRYGPKNIQDLDSLPPYQWELLHRYWPRAHMLGRKFQIYLSRGCPYRCTFCMERAKTEYKWRAYSAERAISELQRLATFTDLSQWVINLADPLFGFQRQWRRQVLEGILEHGLLPRQYWTLTRSDDLNDEDVKLLAQAHFSIGIGAETGSPEMILKMQKAKNPERYLGALERLAVLSRKHGLNWAANIIVGHPGETQRSMEETHAFLTRLFTSAQETCGWLSFDPYRLYPGALIHLEMARYEQQYGTVFYHPEWWKSWYDGPFRAEHIDPSDEVSYEDRVRFMYKAYAPLLEQIQQRFRGQGRSVDRVFKQSLAEQAKLMSPNMRDYLLRRAAQAKQEVASKRQLSMMEETTSSSKPSLNDKPTLELPIGLQVRDPKIRLREQAVRRLLEEGVLRTEALIEAMLTIAPEAHLSEADAESMLLDRAPTSPKPGKSAPWLGIRTYAMALEAMEPGLGDRLADLTSGPKGYLVALWRKLVGNEGEVVAPRWGDPTTPRRLKGTFDRIWIGGAMPRVPETFLPVLADPGGRLVTFLGPRFLPQDLVCLERHGEEWKERVVAKIRVPVLAGQAGWLRS